MSDDVTVTFRLKPSHLERFAAWERQKNVLTSKRDAAEYAGNVDRAGEIAAELHDHQSKAHETFEQMEATAFTMLPDPDSYWPTARQVCVSGDGSVTVDFIRKPSL